MDNTMLKLIFSLTKLLLPFILKNRFSFMILHLKYGYSYCYSNNLLKLILILTKLLLPFILKNGFTIRKIKNPLII